MKRIYVYPSKKKLIYNIISNIRILFVMMILLTVFELLSNSGRSLFLLITIYFGLLLFCTAFFIFFSVLSFYRYRIVIEPRNYVQYSGKKILWDNIHFKNTLNDLREVINSQSKLLVAIWTKEHDQIFIGLGIPTKEGNYSFTGKDYFTKSEYSKLLEILENHKK